MPTFEEVAQQKGVDLEDQLQNDQSGVVGRTFEDVAQQRGISLTPQQTTETQPEGFLGDIGEDITTGFKGLTESVKQRTQNVREAFGRSARGEQNPLETSFQSVGNLAGLVGDVAANAAITAAKTFMGQGAEERFQERFTESLQDTDILGTGVSIPDAAEKYMAWKAENPRAAANLESVVNIADIIPIGAGAKAGTKTVARGLRGLGETVSEVPERLTTRTTTKAVNTYSDILGANKKQQRIMEEFADRAEESLPEYLVKNQVPLRTNDKGTKFATKQVAEEFKNETLGTLEPLLQDVLGLYRGSKTVDLAEVGDQVKNAIRSNRNLPADTINKRIKQVDDLLAQEIDRFGALVDPPTANQIKRNFWRLGYDMLSKQKKPAARDVGRAIMQRIEDSVGGGIVRQINNEMSKALNAADFLEKISGDAVKGGRLGRGYTRVLGTLAGSTGGPFSAFLTGEILTRVMDVVGDVNRLSDKAIRSFQKSGVVPDSIQTVDEARQYILDTLQERVTRPRLEQGAIPLPEKAPSTIRQEIDESAGFLSQEEAAAQIRARQIGQQPRTPLLGAGESQIELPAATETIIEAPARRIDIVSSERDGLEGLINRANEFERRRNMDANELAETLNQDLRNEYLNTGSSDVEGFTIADQELANIFQELDLAEAGRRIFTDEGVVGVSSTFPDWIPEDLRSSDLFQKVIDKLEVSKLSYPSGNRTRQRKLYDVILDELDARIGTDTTEIRNKIKDLYEDDF